jgi:hypothetical protein
MDGRMDRWMDGWMEGWIDGWMDGWMRIKLVLRDCTGLPSAVQKCFCKTASPLTQKMNFVTFVTFGKFLYRPVCK